MTIKEWAISTLGVVSSAIVVTAYVHTAFASEEEVKAAQANVAKTTEQVAQLATRQAVTQQQIEQLVKAVEVSRDEAKEYREALIRLEERTR